MRLREFLPLTGILLPTLILAQSPDTQPKPPVFRSNTRAVVVDVVVTKGDEPITGLRAKDFTILEDGKPQTVDFFEEHTAKTLPPDAIKPLPAMPPGVYTNVPPAPESDSVNVLLLDSLNTEKQDQSYVREQILAFLRKMQPGTRAAVFTLGSRLRFIQGFTTDTSQLLAAMNSTKAGVPERDAAYRSRSDTEDDKEEVRTMMMELAGPGGRGGTDAGVDALESTQSLYAGAQYSNRVAMTFEAIQALARYLAGVPGRKNLLWFAGSYPVTVFPTAAQKQTLSSQRGYLSQVKETADMLTVSNVAVYPINAQGMVNVHGEGADGYARPSMTDYANESADRAATMEAMEQLADDTGGKAFFNTNDLNAAMQHAIADGSHYYTIAYTPTNKKMDGSYRRIEIKIPDTKYKLAYRQGYNADSNLASDAKSDSDPLHPLMILGLPSASQVLYAVHVTPADPQPGANAPHAGRNAKLAGPVRRYGVDFMIRWTDVKLDTAPDGKHTGKVQVELLAYDRDGHALNWAGGTQMMEITPEIFTAIQHSGVPAHIDIDVPADKDVYLQTGVYDWGTGKAGTLQVPLPARETHTASAAKP